MRERFPQAYLLQFGVRSRSDGGKKQNKRNEADVGATRIPRYRVAGKEGMAQERPLPRPPWTGRVDGVMIAALYVQPGGCYYGIPSVDPWDEDRDARLYPGPYPVVAHPPCERWGRYWSGGPSARVRRTKGDDGGCFAAALSAVRMWGGVLEHPEASAAWGAFWLATPPRSGGWIRADLLDGYDGWTCCVEQGSYGHRARKATWLYAHGVADLPSLRWGRAKGNFIRLDLGFHSAEERRFAVKKGIIQRLSKRQRAATPLPFRDLLLSIAAAALPMGAAA